MSNMVLYYKGSIIIGGIITTAIIIVLPISGFDYLAFICVFIFILFYICVLIAIFTLVDIEVKEDSLFIIKKNNLKKINLSGLKINDIEIVKFPYFFIGTSAGNFRISYTNYNYQQIIELLMKISPNRLKLLDAYIKRYKYFPPFNS